jgi:hypothetical protein
MGRIRVSQKGHNAELDDLRYLTLDTDKTSLRFYMREWKLLILILQMVIIGVRQ